MMKLSPDCIQAIHEWVNAGATIAEVQTRLNEKISPDSLTYRDVRFLLDDLGLNIQSKKIESPMIAPEKTLADAAAPEGVKVTLEPIQRPGYLACGQVTFSDGKIAEWRLDGSGRLALIPAEPGYRPTPEDQVAFQSELRTLLG